MKSFHNKFFEKYMKQKAELAELRHKSRFKRGRDRESSLTQPKLSFGAGGTKVLV